MRYNKQVSFYKFDAKTYDPSTGDYTSLDYGYVKFTIGSVMDTKTEMVKLIYGDLKQESKTIIIQGYMDEPFNFIIIDNKFYKCDYRRRLKNKETFIVHGTVQDETQSRNIGG